MITTLAHISKVFGSEEVLKDISFSITDNDRVAIIGKNGAGKSTLLKIIAGLESQDTGTVTIPSDQTLGYIPQAHAPHTNDNVFDILTDKGQKKCDEYELTLALSYFSLESYLHAPLTSLSSGQKTKVFLARLLIEKPDVLLLDEPTNHLDTESLEWLEEYITYYPGSVLFVSHDRMFLDRVATKIVELENGNLQVYGGNYSFYKSQKEIMRLAQEEKYISQQSEMKRLKEELFVSRQKGQVKNTIKKKKGEARGAAGFFANRQAQIFGAHAKNIEKRIDRMEKVEKPESIPELKALFKPTKESGELVYSIKEGAKAFGDTPVLQNITLFIQKKDRIALLGNNGSGKSTLISCLLGKTLLDQGHVQKGANVDVGYLSQEHSELVGNQTVIDELLDKTKKSETECYQLLTRFLIPPDKVRQSVATLSSGEKAKLLLAEIMAGGSNFIILDEPTNHLDIPSREALETALANYEGTLLIISHDRYFLKRIGITRKLTLHEGLLREESLDLS